MTSTFDEPWVISKEEKLKYDTLFEQADLDRDGFVSGHEIKDVFLKSGVAQPVLAHIWGLCDTAEQGKLNNEQFALALWLISRKLKGIDPPPKLTSEMVPPSCRKTTDAVNVSSVILPNTYTFKLQVLMIPIPTGTGSIHEHGSYPIIERNRRIGQREISFRNRHLTARS